MGIDAVERWTYQGGEQSKRFVDKYRHRMSAFDNDHKLRRAELHHHRELTTIRMYPLYWRDLPEGRLQRVLPANTRPLQRVAENIGKQFRREGHYDFQPYEVDNAEDNQEVVLLLKTSTTIPLAAGAAGFKHDEAGTWLEWIWVHPYERGRLLHLVWPDLEKLYGAFNIRPPISPPMTTFLRRKKVDYGKFGVRRPAI